MQPAQQWFNNLKPHEQLLLLCCGAVLLVYLLYLLLWSPLTERQARLEQQNQVAAESLDRVRQLAAEYRALSSSGEAKNNTARGNLSRIVDTSVARNGLAMRRYQPSANGGAQVRFENVAFNNLMGWIHQLEFEHGVLIKDLSITRGSATGLVNVSVRLAQIN